MRHDYRPYIYKLARLDRKWQRILNMNNLFERFFILGVFIAIGAIFAEIGIYILTQLVLSGVNIIRVIEYEPTVNFSAHNFSVLVLGNFAILVLTIGYVIGSGFHKFFHNLDTYVHGAQKEVKHNADIADKEKEDINENFK